jgi:hypothetical protein
MGSYRSKQKSIVIPVILDQENFFKPNETDRHKFFHSTILKRLEMIKEKVKRNKLDLDIEKLKTDTYKILLVK